MTRKRTKTALAAAMGLILCSVAMVFMGQRQMAEDTRPIISAIQKGASMSASQVRQVATKNGITEWALNALSASLVNQEKEAVFEKPSVTFFTQNQGQVLLSADKGQVQTGTNDIKVAGSVSMKNKEYALKTQSLNYQHEKRVFNADSRVNLSGSTFELSADTASFDMKSRQAVFEGNVEGVFRDGLSL